jgi:hypothetical protein
VVLRVDVHPGFGERGRLALPGEIDLGRAALRPALGLGREASAISFTVFGPVFRRVDRIAARVGRDRTLAVRVAVSSPRGLMARFPTRLSPY